MNEMRRLGSLSSADRSADNKWTMKGFAIPHDPFEGACDTVVYENDN